MWGCEEDCARQSFCLEELFADRLLDGNAWQSRTLSPLKFRRCEPRKLSEFAREMRLIRVAALAGES